MCGIKCGIYIYIYWSLDRYKSNTRGLPISWNRKHGSVHFSDSCRDYTPTSMNRDCQEVKEINWKKRYLNFKNKLSDSQRCPLPNQEWMRYPYLLIENWLFSVVISISVTKGEMVRNNHLPSFVAKLDQLKPTI